MAIWNYNWVENTDTENDRDGATEVNFKDLPCGDYRFIVIGAFTVDKNGHEILDKAGNSQISLTLRLMGGGYTSLVYDYLSSVENMAWRIKQFAECVGQPHLYSRMGSLNTDNLKGLKGNCAYKDASWTNNNGELVHKKQVVYKTEHKAAPQHHRAPNEAPKGVLPGLVKKPLPGLNNTKKVENPIEDDVPF